MATKANTVQQQWEQYRVRVIPVMAPPVQVLECKRAFYAAAFAMMRLLRDEVSGLSEDGGVAVLESLWLECADEAKQLAHQYRPECANAGCEVCQAAFERYTR